MGDFRRTKRPSSRKISSQPRYDHFDTSPYMLSRQLFDAFSLKHIQKTDGKNNKIFIFQSLNLLKAFINQEFSVGKAASFLKISSFPHYDFLDTGSDTLKLLDYYNSRKRKMQV